MAFAPICIRKWYPLSSTTQTMQFYRYLSSRRKKNITEGHKKAPTDQVEKWNTSTSETSLLARKMAKQRSEQDDFLYRVESDKNSEMKHFKSRFENLLLEFDNLRPQSVIPTDASHNFFETETDEESVETIMFPSDIAKSSIPSPILGTEDLNIPYSDIPCVGCGAMLQCQHNTFPGFLPSEYFKSLTEVELKRSICQRCYYIRHCNAFKEVTSKPEDYEQIISKIRHTQSVVVVVVDIMDIHGSIIPNLIDYIGKDHPLIVVGNKADLLSPDCPEYTKNVVRQLRIACNDVGLSKIRKVTLVSAKTGFGVERLINTLFGLYKKRVDVFIVGTANAGKSSLFNTLLASDYCKSTARNLIERATVSVWPGTTLNLLKFPILRPSSRVSALRQERLKQEEAQKRFKRQIERERAKQKDKSVKCWELKEDVSITDIRSEAAVDVDDKGEAWGQNVAGYNFKADGQIIANTSRQVPETYDADQFTEGYWTFDTPGVINPDQILNLLSPKEMTFLTPATMIVPRCVSLQPQETLFVSGLCRLDLEECGENIMLAVHCGPHLPLHVVPTVEADDFYLQHVGTDMLGVPIGDKERLAKLPTLIGKQFEVLGEDVRIAVADIQLSSIGWISIAPRKKNLAKLRAYTPGRKGIFLRTPALMQQHLRFKGKRIGGTPFYRTLPPGWIMTKENK